MYFISKSSIFKDSHISPFLKLFPENQKIFEKK
jgi:hypothetical protein